MLANTELYHFKEKFWQNHARDYLAEVNDDIETAKTNLQEAKSRKKLLEEEGILAYKKHVDEVYGVQSATLKKLLRKIKHKPIAKAQKSTKP